MIKNDKITMPKQQIDYSGILLSIIIILRARYSLLGLLVVGIVPYAEIHEIAAVIKL